MIRHAIRVGRDAALRVLKRAVSAVELMCCTEAVEAFQTECRLYTPHTYVSALIKSESKGQKEIWE
jgi:hypothetical protein